jgi:hypothetical protein
MEGRQLANCIIGKRIADKARAPLLTLYHGHPAIKAAGQVIVVFCATAAGFSKCVALLREVRAEMKGEQL